jgi:hypothetical protein
MRFWYGYLDRAISFMDEPHSVTEIFREAVDNGAPEEVIDLIQALLRTIRTCQCGEVCWCETVERRTVYQFSPADITLTQAWYERMAPPNGACWCGMGVSPADTEDLEAHSYCRPGM